MYYVMMAALKIPRVQELFVTRLMQVRQEDIVSTNMLNATQ